ncbi:MAG: hypothetical protein Q9164_005419 [Protoblastenia rupestris]
MTKMLEDSLLDHPLLQGIHLPDLTNRREATATHKLSLDEFQQCYGKVAAIENCDPSLNIHRRFGWLHHRTLLHLQDELSELERELKHLDEYDFKDGDYIRLISRRHDDDLWDSSTQSDRKKLIISINPKMGEYGELLINLKSPIARRLTRFLFTDPEQRAQAGKEVIQLTSPSQRDMYLRAILTIAASILPFVPIVLLLKLQPSHPLRYPERNENYRIITINLFTLLFSASCSMFTSAKKQEIFTATAVYCTVLVIFLGYTSDVVVAMNGLMGKTREICGN